MREYDFLFSMVIPVYNTEQYLCECVDSVIDQTIGIENIQIILVNNASEDGSESICKGYCLEYPNQAEYIQLLENKGPSFARNVAIPHVRGKYTLFLDSDDKLASDALENAYLFFEDHYDEIDVAAFRIKNFEAYGGWHALDYVFGADRVVNIFDEYQCITSTVHAAFKSDAILDTCFDPLMQYCEDTKYVSELILQKGRYGILRSAIYLYRRRRSQTSAIQSGTKYREYYYDYIDKAYPLLADLSKQNYGKIIPYVQYLTMYFLQWRLLDPIPQWMTEDDVNDYIAKIRNILLQIDDYIISEQRNIYKEYKIFCLRLKYGNDVYSQFQLISGKFLFHNLVWCTMDNKAIFHYWWHGIQPDGTMRLTGEVNFPFPNDSYEIFARDDRGNCYPLIYEGNMEKHKLSLGQECLAIRPFEIQMPLDAVSKIEFVLRYQNAEKILYINAGKFSHLSIDPPESYYRISDYIFSRTPTAMLIEPYCAHNAKKHKRALWHGLFKRKDKRAIICRLFAALLRKLSGKQDIRISFGNERIV